MAPTRLRRTSTMVTGLAGALVLSVLPLTATAAASPVVIHATLTTSDLSSALAPQPDITLGPVGSGSSNVTLDDTRAYQTVDGFGAAFTDSSGYVLSGLPTAARDQVMNTLFSRESGIGLSFMREPMGSSDYSATPPANPQAYSYDDNGGAADPTLSHFSVGHDQAYLIPLVKQAQQINPDLELYANDWSPPAWMKTNNSMIPVNGDAGTLTTADYPVLAQYYVRFLQAYAAAGVRVWGITPQNEPSVTPGGYSGMTLSASQEANFVANYLAPAVSGAGLGTRILGADDNPNVNYDESLLANTTVNNDLYAMAYHCYAGNIGDITTIAAAYPKRSYLTECSPPPGIAPMTTAQLAIESTNAGVSGVDTWNLALNPGGGPKMGAGCTNCDGLVTVNPDGTTSYNLGFYQLGQFSKFVQPGATHVGSSDPSSAGGPAVSATAYRNPDGGDVLVATNNDSAARTFTTTWNQQGSFSYTLPAGATVTFTTEDSPALALPAASATTVLYTRTGTGLDQWDFQPSGAWASGDGNEYSNQAGASATLRFTGSGISLYAFPNALNGIVSIAVDGGTPKQVDFSADPTRTPTVMASFAGLDPSASHTLVETVTGTNGAADQGDYGSVAAAVTAADTVAPVVSATTTPAQPSGLDDWYTGPVSVAVAATDNTDPAPVVQAQVDGGDWTQVTGPITLAASGAHTVSVRATDASGNVSPISTVTARIDSTAPVVTLAASPRAATGLDGWYTGPVSVAATATDDQDPALVVRAQVDGAALAQVTGPIALGGDGVHTVSAQATDQAGNVSTATALTVRIDTAPPVSNATVDATARTVTLRAADTSSGVARIEYQLPGGAWTTTTGTVTVGSAQTVVGYRAVDNAGNTEAANTVTVPKAGKALVRSVTSATPSTLSEAAGGTATVRITVTGSSGTPSGTVRISTGGTDLGQATLVKGRATFTLDTAALAPGTYQVAVAYGGDSTFAASSDTVTLTVTRADSTTTLSVSPRSAPHGSPVTATVKVQATGLTPSGTVTIRDGRTEIATGHLTAQGTATVALPTGLAVGSHSLTATYDGTPSVRPSTSATTILTITKGPKPR